MKKIHFCYLASLVFTSLAFGQIASDNASNSPYQPGNVWTNGSNGGFGFEGWALSTSGTAGSYIGTTSLGDPTFGIWAESGGLSSAGRSLNSNLGAGQTISVTLAHSASIASGAEVGVTLFNNGSPAITLKFVGGGTVWQFNDGGSDFGISQGFAANTPLTFEFTWDGGSTYSFEFGSESASGYTATASIDQIDGISFFNSAQGSGENFGFNNLEVIPEPGTMALMGLGLLGAAALRRRFS